LTFNRLPDAQTAKTTCAASGFFAVGAGIQNSGSEMIS
jgi:hypothetical protein